MQRKQPVFRVMPYIWTVINLCLSYLVDRTFEASIGSVSIADGTRLQGQSLTIACQLLDLADASVYIYKTPSKTVNGSHHLAFCVRYCITTDLAYVPKRTNGSLTLRIHKLNRTEDERWWTCTASNSSNAFYLTVFTEPTGLSLESMDCDLAVSACTFICKTSCTYPKLNFTWRYSDGSVDDRLFARVEKTGSNETNGCTDWEGHVSETITIPQYTTFPDNSDRTRNLKCRVKNHLSDQYIESDASGDLRFAVNVKDVYLYDGTKILNASDKLLIQRNANKSLSCISSPTQARPLPTIKLYISNYTIISSSATVVSFQVKEAYHGANVYCESINSLKPVYSEAVQLYVQVAVQNVILKKGSKVLSTGETLVVISGIPFLLSCKPGFSRPASVIDWYVASELRYTSSLTYSLNATNDDHGKEIYCKAHNVHGKEVESPKVKLHVNVLARAPIMLNGSDNDITVPEGKQCNLQCLSTPTRPAATMTWRLGLKTFSSNNSVVTYASEDGGLVSVTSTLHFTASRNDNGSSLICQSHTVFQNVIPETRKTVIVASVPDQPMEFRLLSVIENTALFFWIKGFNGGTEQIFVIQLADDRQNNWSNKTYVYEYEENSYLYDKAYIANITNVRSGSYSVRLLAVNAVGYAKPVLLNSTVVFSPTDCVVQMESCTNIGAAVGWSVASITGVTLIVIVVVIVIRKTRTEWKQKETAPDSLPKQERTQEYANLALTNIAPASEMEGDQVNGKGRRSEPVTYEELGGSREQFHVYKTLQQGVAVRVGDSDYEGVDSKIRQDCTDKSMH